ncbi:hypothetical protein [Hyphomicrobium sulfonivorans]|nr:hypothetical protein [Hyphomicrobium sulfonivorans]
MAMDTIDREDTALIIVHEGQDARALFEATDTAGADRLLAMVRAKIDAFKAEHPSIETEAGRKRIKSFAYKIAQFKTALDAVGKEIVDEAKEIPKRIDANRKHIKDTLDAWRDEVRQPVTDWETAEEARVSRIKGELNELQVTIADPDWITRSSECLRDRLGEIERIEVTEASFNEYSGAADELKAKAIAVLTERITAAETREAEAAELARLRAEAEERARKDREAEIARKAAEDAKREAEAKAEAERLAAQKREADLKAAAEKAEQDRRDAEQRAADAEKKAKEDAERDAKAKADAEEAERKRREQDTAHKARINREAMTALIHGGIDEAIAKQVLTLIIKREIPHVSIAY